MRDYTLLRVFTRGETGGNQLGVVTDIDGLDGVEMGSIAKRLGYSETIYLDLGETEVRARIFTPGAEIPFAGHPLVGAGWFLSALGRERGRILCGIGPVEYERRGEETWIAVPPDRPVQPADPDLASWVVAVDTTTVLMPIPYLAVEVSSPAVVAEASRPPPHIDEVYLWAWEEADRVVKARFFASALGVAEDPATGSAAVALAAVLADRGMAGGRIEIHQGDEVDAPSTLHLEWAPGRVTVGGSVVNDGVRKIPR